MQYRTFGNTDLKLPIIIFIVSALNLMNTVSAQELIPFAHFEKEMVIGLSINSQDRVFVSFPNYDGNGNLALAEEKNGKITAYPTLSWNTKGNYKNSFLRVQDIFVDAKDNLWVLDSKPAASGNIFADGSSNDKGLFKLVKINTQTNQVEKVYSFKNLDFSKSALNDVRIDLKNNVAYLSDPAQAAIVILDLNTDEARTVLVNTKFTKADNISLNYDGVEMKDKNGKPFSSNVNGIALTDDFKYFYFKPINKRELFRIETRYLADKNLSEEALESKVETVAKVGVTHGLIADKKGNIYLTTSESHSISYLTPKGELKVLVKDKRLHWPDSLGIGSDGFLYFSDSQLQRLPQWNNGVDKTEYPYTAYKIALP
ncbi:major royal jelly family protein [Pedobacter sp. BS3]|uniref:major royal jelly family protein n=1 Tax=Pedobacter sp. BS3 TaxID=2567937 RepID=UPI001F5B41D5|nr:major royal jelly family protein [Pedobacter sp. BS3]